MRAEVSDAPGFIFEAPAKNAPAGRPPPEDEDPRSEGKPRLQRLCMRARQRVRRGIVKTAMALLDPTGALEQAWDVDIPGNFFTSLPTPETRASGMEVCSMLAIYILDPGCRGRTGPGPGRTRETQSIVSAGEIPEYFPPIGTLAQ